MLATLPDELSDIAYFHLTSNLTGKVVKAEQDYFTIGGSADIWIGTWKKSSGDCVVAVKVLKGLLKDVSLHKKFLRETRVWSGTDHPHIATLLGVSFDFEKLNVPCLVSVYYPNGNILSYLKRTREPNKFGLLYQIASALAYLHKLSIVHGDVKAANVLIDDNGQACLSDFGLSRILQASGFTTKTSSGTWRFMALELLEGEDEEVLPKVTKASDVWAFAMTVLEILTNALPYSHIGMDARVVGFVLRGGRPLRERSPGIDDKTWAMLEKSWDSDPVQRPSMNFISDFLNGRQSIVKMVVLPFTSGS